MLKDRGTKSVGGGVRAGVFGGAVLVAIQVSFGAGLEDAGRGEVVVPALRLDEAATVGTDTEAKEGGKDDDATKADKWGYNLFNPTPRDQMREFNTDRPDVTEGPFTVDAGHYQAELSLVEYTHDRDHGVSTDGFSVLPGNLRIGLLNNLELDLMPNPYQNVLLHGHQGGQRISSRSNGLGDTEVRAKMNFWGNDGGTTAGGIIPFIKIPSGTGGNGNHHVEGGVIFPLAVSLPWGFDLGTQAEFDWNRNQRNDGYGMDIVHTVTLGHALFSEKLNGYVEYAGVSPVGTNRTYLAYFDTGVTYMLMENVQLDAGINVGLSGRADDFTVFTGLSFRY